MWFKLLQISLLFIFTYSAYGNEQCEFANHSKAPYDATDRFESHPCSDETIRASLTTCEEMSQSTRRRSYNTKGGDR